MVADGLIRVIRVRGWDRHYENSRTLPMKKMQWIPLTNRLDSDGYCTIMGHRNGPSIFGVWIALLEVASVCSPRGFLLKSARTPHDPRSLARLTRIDPRTIRAALKMLYRIKWLEQVDLPASSTPEGGRAMDGNSPSLEGRKEESEGDAAAGSGQPPPAAGGRRRKRETGPGSRAEFEARLRLLVAGTEETPARARGEAL